VKEAVCKTKKENETKGKGEGGSMLGTFRDGPIEQQTQNGETTARFEVQEKLKESHRLRGKKK